MQLQRWTLLPLLLGLIVSLSAFSLPSQGNMKPMSVRTNPLDLACSSDDAHPVAPDGTQVIIVDCLRPNVDNGQKNTLGVTYLTFQGSPSPQQWQSCALVMAIDDTTLRHTVGDVVTKDCTSDAQSQIQQEYVGNETFWLWTTKSEGFSPQPGHTYVAMAWLQYLYAPPLSNQLVQSYQTESTLYTANIAAFGAKSNIIVVAPRPNYSH